jgi:hypothetical protein
MHGTHEKSRLRAFLFRLMLRVAHRLPWLMPRPLSRRIVAQNESCDVKHAPHAADGLRRLVENSRQFALIAPRLAQPDPVDSWEADMLHYFVYALWPHADGRPAHALFVARWEEDVPVSASLFLFNDGREPEVRDLSELLPRH